MQIWFLASISGLRIWCCHNLWWRSQIQPGSGAAVAVASSCSSHLTPGLGTSICCKWSCKKKKLTKARGPLPHDFPYLTAIYLLTLHYYRQTPADVLRLNLDDVISCSSDILKCVTAACCSAAPRVLNLSDINRLGQPLLEIDGTFWWQLTNRVVLFAAGTVTQRHGCLQPVPTQLIGN